MNTTTSSDHPNSGTEQRIVNQLVKEMLAEQRRSRRWGIFFKFLLLIYLLALLGAFLPDDEEYPMGDGDSEGYTALIDINGVISMGMDADADMVAASLRRAFADENVRGIILRINSPGGSPVQSAYIYNEINRLREENPDTKVYAVIVDLCASGGYYVAAAADEIYAAKASLVGSIGVIMSGFGFVDALEKIGVERRLLHAGENKAFLDPFSPVNPAQTEHAKEILAQVHEQFRDDVIEGRGDRLSQDEKIFSGLIWTGEQALELGLVDAIGSAGQVARDVIGAENIVSFNVEEDWFDRISKAIGAEAALTLQKSFMTWGLR